MVGESATRSVLWPTEDAAQDTGGDRPMGHGLSDGKEARKLREFNDCAIDLLCEGASIDEKAPDVLGTELP